MRQFGENGVFNHADLDGRVARFGFQAFRRSALQTCGGTRKPGDLSRRSDPARIMFNHVAHVAGLVRFAGKFQFELYAPRAWT